MEQLIVVEGFYENQITVLGGYYNSKYKTVVGAYVEVDRMPLIPLREGVSINFISCCFDEVGPVEVCLENK